ncbi:hypothetical protein [Paraburkholderia sp.]|jgi:hypothetical protein|uniref:hypothetical protein n=1 Tax=Paraburkholderia sp. TaxID=1926495 RepID=UPI003C7B38F6
MARTKRTDAVDVSPNGIPVYVVIGEREKFDTIALPVFEFDNRAESRGHVLTKSVDDPDGIPIIVFQHWLEE